jgi:hypothetical protein
MLISKESELLQEPDKISPPRLYVCSGDGLGSTGKSAIALSLNHHLDILLQGIPVGQFKEPPYEEVAGFSPYDIVTKGLIAPQAIGPYLAAVRQTMWNGNQNSPWQVPDTPIVIGDRSPAASFYQGAYPGGENPYGDRFWELMYSRFNVPFPDLLPLLFPDDLTAQIRRMEARQTSDQWDKPEKQTHYFEGFSRLSELLLRFPGVYKLRTGQINVGYEDISQVDQGFLLALLAASFAVEKGITTGITEPIILPGGVTHRRIGIERVGREPSVTAYLMNLGRTYFLEASSTPAVRRLLQEKMTVRMGDVGLYWPFAVDEHHDPFYAVIYALEPGAKDLTTESVHEYLDHEILEGSVEVNPDTRYGQDLFTSRFPDIRREWGNISWAPERKVSD